MNYKYTIAPGLRKSVRRLIVEECANYADNECLPKGRGCMQIENSTHLCCNYFVKCVLPIDRALEGQILGGTVKRCKKCGQAFVPNSNRAEYCPDCAAKVRREREAERLREYRARKKGSSVRI